MGVNSNIQWTDHTYNFGYGCTKVDEDCKYCYMMREYNGRWGKTMKEINGKVTRTSDSTFYKPLSWQAKEGASNTVKLVFTSALTDFFHDQVDHYRSELWDIIRACPNLIFQILTKRPERIIGNLPPDWGNGWDNVWLGTSCGSKRNAFQRLRDLLQTPAKVHFLSAEPLIEPLSLNCVKALQPAELINRIYINPLYGYISTVGNLLDLPYKLDWVIVGGESGHKKEDSDWRYRPCQLDWIEDIVESCQISETPVFVKQLGTYLSGEMSLKDSKGGNVNEFPSHLRLLEFPKAYYDYKEKMAQAA